MTAPVPFIVENVLFAPSSRHGGRTGRRAPKNRHSRKVLFRQFRQCVRAL